MRLLPALAARGEFSGDEGSKFIYRANGFWSRQTCEHVREAAGQENVGATPPEVPWKGPLQHSMGRKRNFQLNCRNGKASVSFLFPFSFFLM